MDESIHWDTLLTRPVQYLKRKQIKLYHYSDRKLDKITPIGMNAGNKLAGPRISSWWTEHDDEWALPVQIYLKCKYREYFGTEVYWDAKALHAHKNADGTLSVGMLITKEFYNKHKSDIDKLVVYRHEKTFDIRDVGRGTEPTVPEWTTELEVEPDKVTKLNIKGLFEHDAISFATREEIIEAKEYRDMLSKKYNTPYVFPYLSNYKVEWWKYNGNQYKLKRKQAEEKNNVDSYKDIHMKAIKEDIHWDTLLTKPSMYNKQITLYRMGHVKDDKVYPFGRSVGNKLWKGGYSSWWAEQPDETMLHFSQQARALLDDFKEHCYMVAAPDDGRGYKRSVLYLDKEYYYDNLPAFNKIEFYRYTKTFNVKDLHRGQEYAVHEWTYPDIAIPDKVETLHTEDCIKNGSVILVDNLDKIKHKYPNQPKYIADVQDKPWLYHEYSKVKKMLKINKEKGLTLNPKYADKFISPDELKLKLKRKSK